MGKFGTIHSSRKEAAKQRYLVSEINRLLEDGVSLSKTAKLLDIEYNLAKRLKDVTYDDNEEGVE